MWLALLGCVNDGSVYGSPPAAAEHPNDPEDSAAPDTGDTAAPVTWTPLPVGCEAPADLPAAAWERTGWVDSWEEGVMMELVDLEVWEERAWGVGQGGLWVVDVADPTRPATLGYTNPSSERFHRVERLDDAYVATSHRDQGLRVLDVSDPARQLPEYFEAANGMEGLYAVGNRLYVTSREEGLITYDLTDPARPARLGSTPGLELPWELAGVADGAAYVADTELGLVPVDLRDPDRPALMPAIDLGAPAFHVEVAKDAVYVAAGGAGVVVLDRADRGAPEVVRVLETGGSVLMTAVDGDLLYAVDHEAMSVWSVVNPLAPTPITRVPTNLHALAVAADEGVGWLGAWSRLEGYRVDPQVLVGAVDVALDTVRLTTGEVAEVQVVNRGGGPLTLAGAALEGVEGTVETDRLRVEPGEAATLRVTPSGVLSDTLVGSLCLATDDPASPLTTIELQSGVVEPPLGEPAPDFTLADLDGVEHTLSAEEGYPVLLVYFATW